MQASATATDRRCELCRRAVEKLTNHHLIPRTRHRNRRVRRDRTPAEIHRTIRLCPPCHANLHALLTEKQLADSYDSLESLRSNPAVARFTDWIRNRATSTRVPVRRRRDR